MNPPDNDVVAFIKDFLWAPLLGLIAWGWSRNEKDHDELRKKHEAIRAHHEDLRDQVSTSQSKLNDRMMEHIDDQVRETRAFVVVEDGKLMAELGVQRGHIGKIFDKMEQSAIRADDRHTEVMRAIHDLSTTMHQALANKADR